MADLAPIPSSPSVGSSALRRPFRSLRWRLQAWHGVVLTGVLTVFGLVVYALAWESRLQQIDAELDRSAEVITSRLRRLFPWPQPGRGPGRWSGPPTRGENEPADRGGPRSEDSAGRNDAGRGDRPPRGPRPRDNSDAGAVSALTAINVPHNPLPGLDPFVRDVSTSRMGDDGRGPRPFEWVGPIEWPTPNLGLPEDFLQLFEGDEDSRLYFVVYFRDGRILQKSESAPEVPFPGVRVGEDKLPVRIVRVRGTHREVVHASSMDNNVLVGRSLVHDRAAQRRSGLLLALAGVAVLAAGLVGGWWTSSRAIRPIAAMTAAAQSISAQRLSQRIDLQETDNELGQLATVLNGTFDRLQTAFEQQTRFTADASHELRTPVAVILAHADLALSRSRSPEEYRTTLETCRSAARRMKSLIDGLLTLARFDSDATAMQFETLDLRLLVQECLDLVRPLATERGIVMEAELTEFFCRVDRSRISQVITNLLTNAIRYNRDGGTVRVTLGDESEARTDDESSCAMITVADTGIGIAPEDLPRIFDRFYQVDQVRSRADGSSGLGLSISQTIVVAHGGSLTARSEPGVGTTMEVRLPQQRDVA